MKKTAVLVMIFVLLCASLCGCGGVDPVGEYQDVSLAWTGVKKADSEAKLIITKDEDKFAYEDGKYSGVATLEENTLNMIPKKGVNDRSQALFELELKRGANLEKAMLAQDGYLIDKLVYEDVEIDGEFEGKKTACTIEIDFSSHSIATIEIEDVCIELYEDGTCELEGGFENSFTQTEFFYEGTYEIIGGLLVLDLDYESIWQPGGSEQEARGNWICAIFIEGDRAYTGVYAKTK